MVKVMHLDMFCFEYQPVFTENEKVVYKDGKIIVSYKDKEKVLDCSDVSNIKIDTLFSERVQHNQNLTCSDLLESLKSLKSDNNDKKEKYRLCIIEPEDEKDVSFDFMIQTFLKLNYKDDSFECIASGK